MVAFATKLIATIYALSGFRVGIGEPVTLRLSKGAVSGLVETLFQSPSTRSGRTDLVIQSGILDSVGAMKSQFPFAHEQSDV
jgi:hypothetical protein